MYVKKRPPVDVHSSALAHAYFFPMPALWERRLIYDRRPFMKLSETWGKHNILLVFPNQV